MKTGIPLTRSRLVVAAIFLGVVYLTYRVVFVLTVRPPRCACSAQTSPISTGSRIDLPGKLVVASYNIQGSGAIWRGNHLDQVAEVLRRANPDIAGLQEVHRFNWQSRFADQTGELAAITGLHSTFGRSFGVLGTGFGNALLTRGPIASSIAHRLPGAGEPRSLLEARVLVDGGEINAFVTHLAAWGGLNRVTRCDQIACIIEHLRCSPLPFVLIADLNVEPSAPEMQQLLSSGLLSACGGMSQPTYKLTSQRLDYIFVSGQLECGPSSVIRGGPSDHRLLMTEVRHRKDHVKAERHE